MKIILLGYMASGKSFIGKDLAYTLNFNFIDLDDFIEKKENKSITNIIVNKGEIYFRKLERKCLLELLMLKNNQVISLGGGTPCYFDNMKVLFKDKKVKTIYLKSNIDELSKRLYKNKKNRPLISHLKSKEEIIEFVSKHLFERSFFYNQAEYIVDTSILKKKSIIESILFKLF